LARYSYERLSAQDASFLFAEQPNQPMHVGALAVFETGPLRREDGGFDIDRYRRAVEGVLHWIPRYRQRLEWIPVEVWPVWVDDRQFDLGYHIRHIALPRPGRIEQLKELAARINARPLARSHPLWELWVIEGLEDGAQFAVMNKIHHCMVDGAAGADLSQILMSPSPRAEVHEPLPYLPRPAPSPGELLLDAIGLGLKRPLAAVRSAAAAVAGGDGEDAPSLESRLHAIGDLVGFALRPASETPINGELGAHRRLDWLTMPLDDVRELKDVLGCTINDVVLATVTGAMRRYLFRRRVDHRRIEFRVAAPVSTRRAEHDRRQGNHVSTWIVPLPLGADDPLECLEAVQEKTRELKRSEAALAVDTLMQVAEFLPAPLITRGVGLAQGPANMIVTNVPGPQFPLYSVGARLLESHLEVADFSALGQRLGHTDLRIQSEPRTWRVSIDSQAVNGTLDIPREGPARAPIVATMQRLYIASNEDAPAVFTDPRDLPGLRLEAQEFALDNRRFGHFTADFR